MRKYQYGDRQTEAVAKAAAIFFNGVGKGIGAIKQNKAMRIVFITITLMSGVIFYLRHTLITTFVPQPGFHILKVVFYGSLLIPLAALYLLGSEGSAKGNEFDEVFAQIKFANKAGTLPQLIKKEKDGKKTIYSFRSPGLSADDWRMRRVDVETALDCNIVKFEPSGHSKQVLKVHTVATSQGLSINLHWKNEFIREKDFEIVVGEGLLDEVSFNLDKYPHALIAGVTGSGKSVILRCMLWQCIVKGARAFMIDFKGGVEFTAFEAFGEVITDRSDAVELLKELSKEMRQRLSTFKEAGVKNLTEYNRKFPKRPLCRIVLVCDEIAEMLDKTGLAKADAAIYYEIEKELSSIARLARAPGINMLLATQRPDAKVIVGQIKNNLPIRISGRMTDPQASEMVLGNTKAADLGDILGRFLYSVGADTYEFQAYNFQDKSISNGTYQRGGMLLEKTEEMTTADETDDKIDDEGGEVEELTTEAMEAVAQKKQNEESSKIPDEGYVGF